MRLALAEMRRRRGRWLSITGAVAFIVFLVLFLVAYSAMPVLTSLLRAPGLKGWRDGMLM